jgi:hypothetical protein
METTTTMTDPSGLFAQVFSYTWWIILPMTFYYVFEIIWLDFVREKSQFSWYKSLEFTLLEVIPPMNIEKGPKLMESIYTGVSGVFVTHSTYDQYIKGAFTDKFSFELVGEEGSVHFYIRTQKKYRNLIEAQIYSKYPDAEIVEVEDYTMRFPKVVPNKEWDLWGSDFELTMPDPYPIKTYDRFEENVTGKMIDPFGALMEVIGTLTPGQHIWLQFIIEPVAEKWRDEEMKVVKKLSGRLKDDKKSFMKSMGEFTSNTIKGFSQPVEFSTSKKDDSAQWLDMRLTPVERETLKAVEENLGRVAFKTKMRMIYIGHRANFDKSYVSAFVGAIKQFNDLNLNNLKPNDISKTYANYFFKDSRLSFRQRKIFNRYRSRNVDGKKMLLTTKELATVYHFPDMEVQAPSLMRVGSKKSTAPFNLPVG